MSLDIRFGKVITLGMLKDHTDFEIEYYDKNDIWVARKCYSGSILDDQFIQFSITSVDGIELDETPINDFTLRGSGSLMIREMSLCFQSEFLTEDYEYNLYYEDTSKWDEHKFLCYYNDCMVKFGVMINGNKEIVEC